MKRGKLTMTFKFEEYHESDPSFKREVFNVPDIVWDGVHADAKGRMEAMGLWKGCNDVFLAAGASKVPAIEEI